MHKEQQQHCPSKSIKHLEAGGVLPLLLSLLLYISADAPPRKLFSKSYILRTKERCRTECTVQRRPQHPIDCHKKVTMISLRDLNYFCNAESNWVQTSGILHYCILPSFTSALNPSFSMLIRPVLSAEDATWSLLNELRWSFWNAECHAFLE